MKIKACAIGRVRYKEFSVITEADGFWCICVGYIQDVTRLSVRLLLTLSHSATNHTDDLHCCMTLYGWSVFQVPVS